ncbi:hypothetical protein ACJJTC_016204 [Scirpophaga incertulas]
MSMMTANAYSKASLHSSSPSAYISNDDSVENYSKECLKQLLLKRIGMETFTAKLGEVSKHEAYSRASKHPQLRAKYPADLLLNYEFCRLFKSLEGAVTQSLSGPPADGEASLAQYKSLIRQQDQRLSELAAAQDSLLRSHHSLQSSLNESLAANALLKDENTLLKAQVSAAGSMPAHNAAPPPSIDHARVHQYEESIQKLTSEVDRLTNELSQCREAHKLANEELDKLRKDQDDLLELLADQDTKLNEYKMRLLSLGQVVTRNRQRSKV